MSGKSQNKRRNGADFLNLKMECVWQKRHADHAEATNDIAGYIIGVFNSFQLHSKLDNWPSNIFKRESASKNCLPIRNCLIGTQRSTQNSQEKITGFSIFQ